MYNKTNHVLLLLFLETLPLLSLLTAISKSQMFTSKPHSESLGQLLLTLYPFANGHEEEFKNTAHVVVSRTAHQCPPEDTLVLVQSLLQHQTEVSYIGDTSCDHIVFSLSILYILILMVLF